MSEIKLEEEPEDQYSEAGAICPYCMYSNYVEGEDCGAHEREEQCSNCGKTFIQYDEVSVTHYTRPLP